MHHCVNFLKLKKFADEMQIIFMRADISDETRTDVAFKSYQDQSPEVEGS